MTKLNDTRGPKDTPNNTDYNPLFIGVNLSPKDLNSLIYKKGVRCKVYDIIPCPNVKSIDGREHEFPCNVCDGSGFLDVNPQDTYAFSQSYNKDLMKNAESIVTEWEDGTAYFSFASGTNLSYFSKVMLVDYAKPYYEHVQRQAGSSDKVRYPITSKVRSLVDKTGKSYTQGTDFVIEEGMVKWNAGKAPATGTIYAINYDCNVVYRCMSALHQGRYGTNEDKVPDLQVVEYPEQWKVKLDYLIQQKKGDGTIIDPNNIFPPGE